MPPGRKMVQNAGAKRVTLKFLAEYLGLSPTTVSVVLTNSPLSSPIAKPTKDRVWEAARKFGYRPTLFARSLHMTRTFRSTVLVLDIAAESSALLDSRVYAQLTNAEI